MDIFDQVHADRQAGKTHPLGKVTAIDHATGLPIVKRAERGAEKPTAAQEKPEETAKKPEIGDKEPKTGRDVVQPSDSPEDNQKLATEGLKEILPALQKIVHSIPGVTLEKVRPEKDSQRTSEKIQDEGKPSATIPDYAAVRISVDSLEDNDKLVEAIKKQFPIAKEKNELEQGSPEEGFHAMALQVQAPNQATIELQILPKEQADIAESTHPDYVKARSGDQDAKASLKQQNDDAMQKFSDRQSKPKEEPAEPSAPESKPQKPARPQFKKGDHVLLPDSRSATVDFHDSRLTGNARVTADDGEKIQSVAGKKLTPVGSEAAKEGEPWVGFDLDKTLAKYSTFQGPTIIGAPIPAMISELKKHLVAGDNVRIVTARVAKDTDGKAKRAIEAWLQKNVGQALPVTDKKDEFMTRLYDDKAVAVEPNTGKILGGKDEAGSSNGVHEVQKEATPTAGNERSPVQSAHRPSSADALKSAFAARKPKEEQEKLVQMKPPKGHTVVKQHFRKLP